MMLRVFARNSLIYMLALLLNRGLGFLLLPVYTRCLTPADYGVLGLCTTSSYVFLMVSTFSLEAAVGIYYFKLETGEFQRLLGTVWLFLLIVPLLVAGGCELLGPSVAGGILPGVPWRPYLQLTLWGAYFGIVPGLALALLRSEQRAAAYATFTVASFLVSTGLLIYFVAVRHEGAAGSLRAQLIAAVTFALISHFIVLLRCRPTFVGRHLIASLRLCVPILPHSVCMWALNVSDRLILGHFVSLSALGIYNLAYTLGMVVHISGTALSTAYAPVYYGNVRDEQFRAKLPRLIAGYFLIHTFVLLGISMLAPEILRLMTHPAYYSAAALVPWVAAGYWFFVGIYHLSVGVIQYHERTAWMVLITGPAALINVWLNWVFVPRFGILAAAVNTLVAFLVMGVLAVCVSQRLDCLPYPKRALMTMLMVAAASYWLGMTWLTLPHPGMALASKTLLLLLAGALMAHVSGFRAGDVLRLRRVATPASAAAH